MSAPKTSRSYTAVTLNREDGHSVKRISTLVDNLKNQVISDRRLHIKERMEANSRKVLGIATNFHKLSMERRNSDINCDIGSVDLLAKRQKDATDMLNGIGTNNGVDDSNCTKDGYAPSAVLLGSNIAVKHAVHTIKMPKVEKIPMYTTWIFLDKNQRMPEDQSVVGRRRIYYDRNGGEALICSDSEEEETGDEYEEKKEFAETEDYILRTTIKEMGLYDVILGLLSRCLSRTAAEIEERYEYLTMNENENAVRYIDTGENIDHPCIDKDLDAALDSFDNLFCRRCLVFYCRLHGCSQDLVFPAEKQLEWSEPDAMKEPCGPNCHRLSKSVKNHGGDMASPEKRSSKRSAENALTIKNKKQKSIAASNSVAGSGSSSSGRTVYQDKEGPSSEKVNSTSLRKSVRKDLLVEPDNGCWKPFEKAIYEKGIQMFGYNSCLIARNLLSGLKTCSEIQKYMSNSKKISNEGDDNILTSPNLKSDDIENDVGGSAQAQRRSRFLRRRGRVRRLKYTWRSTGHQSRKRISEKRDQPCRQYNPCGCKSACGKACPCLVNGTCCEKYCGCPKSCKNRFRGCHCAKSQCRSRQCPCFAANRECDPDVCRNCWISCGDGGTLGMPSQRGDNYECRNMKLLLRQQQRVLLGRSDVCGWGAFLRHTVAKHEYLGEYTGEIISHREADKRGKIYDRENSSFLFNLNDQFVLDAHRKGDKLKFANHSLEPNCYAKVIMVAGDHRVGIFAKERIHAGGELFYDYRYEPDRAPAWAKKPEASGSTKKETGGGSSGRAKKHI